MSSMIDALPGQELPIASVNETLTEMWYTEKHGDEAPSEFRASQMNLILHFGKDIDAKDARQQFDIAIEFAQRYPCRIIVLCPRPAEDCNEDSLNAKLYTQCFIGPDQREMCCCEALILSYHLEHKEFLQNQVSVWLENDLPVYYWFHGLSVERINERWLPFLKQCTTVVYDSAHESDDYSKINWPENIVTYDLAAARLLQIRQAIGQLLSGFSPKQISDHLRDIVVSHSKIAKAEARQLGLWLEDCLEECFAQLDIEHLPPAIEYRDSNENDIIIEFKYSDEARFFKWSFDSKQGLARSSCKYGVQTLETPMKVAYLSPEKALSEALFFN